MKNNGVVITVLLVIVLVHAAVLGIFLWPAGNKEKVTETKIVKTPVRNITEKTVADQPQVPVQPTTAQAQQTQPVKRNITPEEYRRLRAQASKAGQPITYRWAVNGNIASLPLSSQVPVGILVDVTTRKVLWCKNPRKVAPIASMTKIMTVLIAYEDALAGKDGLSLDTQIRVTRAAHKIGGSQVYLDPRESFSLSELMRAAAIQSANDAAYLIAEFIGHGSVEEFVDRMNAKAKQLGMNNTNFTNPHGLPASKRELDNSSTPEDMVKLAEETMKYPLLIEWASTYIAYFREKDPNPKKRIQMRNHNHLVPGHTHHFQGVNGLKTGYTNRAGYCLTVTCDRNGHKLVGVVMNCPKWQIRDNFVKGLLGWGYARANDPEAALRRDAAKAKQRPAPAPSQKKSSTRRSKKRTR